MKSKRSEDDAAAGSPRLTDVIKLDVGGTRMKFYRRTLMQVEGSADDDGYMFISQPSHLFRDMMDTLVCIENESPGSDFVYPPTFQGNPEDWKRFHMMTQYYGVTPGLYRTQLYRCPKSFLLDGLRCGSFFPSEHHAGWFADYINGVTIRVTEEEIQSFIISPLAKDRPRLEADVLFKPPWSVKSYEFEIVETHGVVDVSVGFANGRGSKFSLQQRKYEYGKVRMVNFGKEVYMDGVPRTNIPDMYIPRLTSPSPFNPIPYMSLSKGTYKVRVLDVTVV
jgi:hypothetical protein